MLHQGNNKYVLLIIALIVISCNTKRNKGIKKNKKYDPIEIQEIRNRSLQISQSIIGTDEYWKIYNNWVDSVNLWIEDELYYYKYLNQFSEF